MPKRIEHREEPIVGVETTGEYAQKHKKHAQLQYKAFLKDFRSLPITGKCLEIGAGPGFLATMIAEANPHIHITALDLSSDMAIMAQEHIKEKELTHRIHYCVGDISNEKTIESLGKFEFVYSTFSLHHWKDPEKSIDNLWNAVQDNGVLYIHDFKRVWWLYYLPLKHGNIESIKASYTPKEIENILSTLPIHRYTIKTLFPFFLQSIIASKT